MLLIIYNIWISCKYTITHNAELKVVCQYHTMILIHRKIALKYNSFKILSSHFRINDQIVSYNYIEYRDSFLLGS